MTTFLHFDKKVHRKDQARAKVFTIDVEVAMPRLRASWVPGGATY